MGAEKVKIFLSYHKNTPCYKSDVFQPIHVGALNSSEAIEFAIKDSTGENISELNPYYCELTGHYWVLKNYIENCNEEYVGFSHYRRLPDLASISKEDVPSIYGIGYSDSVKLFNTFSKLDLFSLCEPYDIILPCSVYLYAKTVNPLLREDEPHYNMYQQFKIEHKSNLLDVLKDVIYEFYPEYKEALLSAFKMEKTHYFNIYIIKKIILKSFLEWEFDILERIGTKIGGWNQEKYLRMAGFVGECLTNIWLVKNNNNYYALGYVPIYIVDFESEFYQKADILHKEGKFREEIDLLARVQDIITDKFWLYLTMSQAYFLLSDMENCKKNLYKAETYALSGDEYIQLANFSKNFSEPERIVKYYKKAIEYAPDKKYYASAFLFYAKSTNSIELTDEAWKYMLNHDLSDVEQSNYESFMRIKNKLANKNI